VEWAYYFVIQVIYVYNSPLLVHSVLKVKFFLQIDLIVFYLSISRDVLATL
jgi:hypothetical protein